MDLNPASQRTRLTELTTVMCLMIGGCQHAARQSHPNESSVAISREEFQKMIAAEDSITFRSYSGKWIGGDNDVELDFFPGDSARLTVYGVYVKAYRGTYTLDAGGTVRIHLPTYRAEWPAMSLRRDSISPLLQPVASENGAAAAADDDDDKDYWPFRTPLEDGEAKPDSTAKK